MNENDKFNLDLNAFIDQKTEEQFATSQQIYLNTLGKIVSGNSFTQEQINEILSIVEFASKRAAKFGALIAVDTLMNLNDDK